MNALIDRAETYLQKASEDHPDFASTLGRAIAAAYAGNPKAIAYLEEHVPVKQARWPLVACPEHGLPDYEITPTAVQEFAVGLSPAFYNKARRDGYGKQAYRHFETRYVTPTEFIDFVLAGNAWSPGTFIDDTRLKANFMGSQVLALDFDDNVSVHDCQMDLLMSEYAALIHPSPSSTDELAKTRVIFLLSEPVHDLNRIEAMLKALIEHYSHMGADKQCKDGSRFFYGSDLVGASISRNASLPIEIAQALADDYQRRQQAQRDQRRLARPARIGSVDSDKRKVAYVQKAIDDELLTLRTQPEGERNNTLFKCACNLYGFAKGDWPITQSDLDTMLIADAQACGLERHEIEATLNSAWRTAQARIA